MELISHDPGSASAPSHSSSLGRSPRLSLAEAAAPGRFHIDAWTDLAGAQQAQPLLWAGLLPLTTPQCTIASQISLFALAARKLRTNSPLKTLLPQLGGTHFLSSAFLFLMLV